MLTGTLGHCRFHTVTTGGGRGKPLMLFLHGFPELWYSWRRQLENFADDFEVGASHRTFAREQLLLQ